MSAETDSTTSGQGVSASDGVDATPGEVSPVGEVADEASDQSAVAAETSGAEMHADEVAETSPNQPQSATPSEADATKAVPAASVPAATERVYVEIPRLKPGQGYHAPKNYQQPTFELLSKIIVVLMCVSLPIAPAVIFVMILAFSHAIQQGLLWLWIVMILLIEPLALLLAWGVAREALGIAGSENYIRRK